MGQKTFKNTCHSFNVLNVTIYIYTQNVMFLKLVILQSSSIRAERTLKGPLKSKNNASQWTESVSPDQHLPIKVMDYFPLSYFRWKHKHLKRSPVFV